MREFATRQYCKSIGSAVAAANLLRQQLIDAGIEFIDPGNDEAGISYGESIRDKNAMRVNMLIDIPDMTRSKYVRLWKNQSSMTIRMEDLILDT